MTNYKRGAQKEYDICKIMREAGYNAQRSAGSHGVWDVCCIGPNGVRFIQVKRSKKEWKADYESAKHELQQMPRLTGGCYEVWVWVDGQGWIIREVV